MNNLLQGLHGLLKQHSAEIKINNNKIILIKDNLDSVEFEVLSVVSIIDFLKDEK